MVIYGVYRKWLPWKTTSLTSLIPSFVPRKNHYAGVVLCPSMLLQRLGKMCNQKYYSSSFWLSQHVPFSEARKPWLFSNGCLPWSGWGFGQAESQLWNPFLGVMKSPKPPFLGQKSIFDIPQDHYFLRVYHYLFNDHTHLYLIPIWKTTGFFLVHFRTATEDN